MLQNDPQIPGETAYRFEVGLSFPDERRSRVEAVAQLLAKRLGSKRVLYDHWYRGELAKPGLNTYLPDLYRKESRLIVCFLCSEYGGKNWCGLEWRACLELIQEKKYERLMLLKFDDAEIPGVYSGDGYIDLRKVTNEELVQEIFSRLGLVSSNRSPSIVDDLLPLMSALDDEKLLRPHYVRSITKVTREPRTWSATSPGEMLEQLCEFPAKRGEPVSRPLLEFLERLRCDARLSALQSGIEAWIARMPIPAFALKAVRELLNTEARRFVLVVELEEDRSQRAGEIAAFQACLFGHDSAMPARAWARRPVSAWRVFEAELLDVIEQVKEIADPDQPLAIEFLLNPPLMAQAPHAIERNGEQLGSNHPVSLRWRDRHQSQVEVAARIAWKTAWERCVQPLAQLPIHPLEDGPCKPGVGYLQMPLPVVRERVEKPCRAGFDLLHKAVKRGAPFLFWLHEAPRKDRWEHFETELRQWLAECGDAHEFPEYVRGRRFQGSEYAINGSLLWDDPDRIRHWDYEELSK